MLKWNQKKVAGKYIVLYDGDDEVSVHLDKRKGLIKRKSYSSPSNAKSAYGNINSVKSIKRFVGKNWKEYYETAKLDG